MDAKLAGKIKSFPGEIMKIQESLQDILDNITEWTDAEDYSQLKMLMPRLSYMLAMIDILEDDMKSVADRLGSDVNLAVGEMEREIPAVETGIKDSQSGEVAAETRIKDPQSEVLARENLTQQLSALTVIKSQIENLSESIKLSVKSIETSDRERLASDIIQRSNELKKAMRELK